jgi:hypothetical protein
MATRKPRIWFDPPLFSWRRVLITAALAAFGVIGWLLHDRGLWPPGPEPVLEAAVMQASASATARAALRGAAAARVAALVPAASATASLASGKTGQREIEVCGLGAVKVERESGGETTDPLEQAQKLRSSTARSAWEAAMAGSPDVRVRAAGLRMAAAARGAGDAPNDKLARLALDSRDPMVYALAMYQCQVPPPGACQMLSREQWATIDPDNAAPWLDLAEAALARKADPSEAMHRAARARYIKSYRGSLHALVMDAQPPATPALDRVLMAVEAAGASRTVPPSLGPTLNYCSAPALRDVNRRQSCEALAELLANRADTLADLATARSLGERLGWPPERLAALRDEKDALSGMGAEPLDPAEQFSCAGIERQVAYYAEVARRGDLGALREALRRSGQSVEELALRARREQAEALKRPTGQVQPPEGAASTPPRS